MKTNWHESHQQVWDRSTISAGLPNRTLDSNLLAVHIYEQVAWQILRILSHQLLIQANLTPWDTIKKKLKFW